MLISEYISKFIFFSIFDLWAADCETTKAEMCLLVDK